MTPFILGFAFGVMALWIFLELIALAAKRKIPAVTMAGRKRKLPGESAKVLTHGDGDWLAPYVTPEDRGIDYKFMGVTGSEE